MRSSGILRTLLVYFTKTIRSLSFIHDCYHTFASSTVGLTRSRIVRPCGAISQARASASIMDEEEIMEALDMLMPHIAQRRRRKVARIVLGV